MVRGVSKNLVEFFVDVVDIELAIGKLAQLLVDLVFDAWDKLAVLDDSVELGLPRLQILDLVIREVVGKKLSN